MANEFKHGTVGTELTQAEYEAVGGHVVDSQAVGDIIYASTTSQLIRLGIGSTNDILMVKSGIPDWEAQTQITSVGTIATGTWQGTDIGVAYGGTGVSTLLANAILTGNGASAIQAETTLLFSSNKLIPTASAHDAAGTVLTMSAGATTAGTTNNIAGGALTFQGGQGKGSGAGGDIIFQTANAGGSGSSLNALATALTISDDLSATFAGSIVGTLGTASQTNITGIGTITTGTWQGTAIASAYLDSDTAHLSGTQTFTGAKTFTDTVTVGANTDGQDVKFFGNSSGSYMLYDESEDDLYLIGGRLAVGSTTMGAGEGGINLQNDGGFGLFLQESASLDNYLALSVNSTDDIAKIYSGSGGSVNTHLAFYTAASGAESEAMRITSGGNVLIGGNEADVNEYELQIVRDETTGNGQTQMAMTSYSATSTDTNSLVLRKSAHNTIGNKAATGDGEWLGAYNWYGTGYYDSNLTFTLGAYIQGKQNGALDGTTVSKVPTDMIFSTSTTGSNHESMRLTKDRQLLVGGYDEPLMASSTQSAVEVTNYTANQHPRMVLNAFGTTDSTRGYINFTKSASDTIGTMAQTSASEALGNITFSGVNADNSYKYSSRIIASAVGTGASGQNIPGSLQFECYDTGGAHTAQLFLNTNGRVGILTSAPGNIFDINSGSGNMIADGYDTHSLSVYKEDIITSTESYLNKLKLTPVKKWKKKPFVNASDIKRATIEQFGKDAWEEYFPQENSHRNKGLEKMPDGEMKNWIDSWREQKRVEMRQEEEWQRPHLGLVADGEDTTKYLPEVISKDSKGNPQGIKTMEYIAMLHSAIIELSDKIDKLDKED